MSSEAKCLMPKIQMAYAALDNLRARSTHRFSGIIEMNRSSPVGFCEASAMSIRVHCTQSGPLPFSKFNFEFTLIYFKPVVFKLKTAAVQKSIPGAVASYTKDACRDPDCIPQVSLQPVAFRIWCPNILHRSDWSQRSLGVVVGIFASIPSEIVRKVNGGMEQADDGSGPQAPFWWPLLYRKKEKKYT